MLPSIFPKPALNQKNRRPIDKNNPPAIIKNLAISVSVQINPINIISRPEKKKH
jgi:hypothetical protein